MQRLVQLLIEIWSLNSTRVDSVLPVQSIDFKSYFLRMHQILYDICIIKQQMALRQLQLVLKVRVVRFDMKA